MDKEKTCDINYEAEFHRMSEEYQALQVKYSELVSSCKGMEMELFRMKAQLDIVHLIFGK